MIGIYIAQFSLYIFIVNKVERIELPEEKNQLGDTNMRKIEI
jgi:hypothetical protein